MSPDQRNEQYAWRLWKRVAVAAILSAAVFAAQAEGNTAPLSTDAVVDDESVVADTLAPRRPWNLSVDIVNNIPVLTWLESPDNVATTGYAIHRADSREFGPELLSVGPVTTFADTSVVPGRPYTYAVVAFDAAGNYSAHSRLRSISVPEAPDNTPSVTLSAEPTSVLSGETATLSWSSENVTACTASGGWAGEKAMSGSESSAPLVATTSFTLSCTGDYGPAEQSVTVTVREPAPAPTVTLSADPIAVETGSVTTLSWSSTDATSCTASDGWSGGKATSGSESTAALVATTQFTLSCTGEGGTSAQSVTVTVTEPVPVPSVTLSAEPTSVLSGETATLSWSSENVTACAASGGWAGDKPTSGSEASAPLVATTSFTLSCTGDYGPAEQSVTVTVREPAPAPTVTLSADPIAVETGSVTTLSWSSTDATSCTASDGWSGGKATSGSESTAALAATTQFTLSCTGEGGTAAQSVTVTVTEPVPVPSVTLSAEPGTVAPGEPATLTWSSANVSACSAHDGWTGPRPTSGSESTGPLSATTSFTLECLNDSDSAWETVTVFVQDPANAITDAAAFRFLSQSTFGPTQSDIQALVALGDAPEAYGRWIADQMALPASLELPATQAAVLANPYNPRVSSEARRTKWFENAVNGQDQLRLRVAFALSQILVVSEVGPLWRQPLSVAAYNDTLVQHAFGNFRELLEDVTLHPAMGVYLSALGNQKPDPVLNIRSDENYARELMQLFSIGLVQLNTDGTEKLDSDGVPIPTYDQSTIENFARVFTGWHYAGAAQFSAATRTNENQVVPMQAYPEQHDTDAKTLLSYPGVVKPALPAGQSAEQDLADALDNVFNHPNVGPFIAGQLIKRLVTSNPSPAYVARVAATFNDDGNGERGNLAAVVRAILLDAEARAEPASDTEGKLKEPLLRLTHLWRAYDAAAANGEFKFDEVADVLGEGPLLSPSVFNFFSPSFAPVGEVADRGLVAPEAEIITEHRASTAANFFYDQVFLRNSTVSGLGARVIVLNIDEEVGLAADTDALVTRIAAKLLGGLISPQLKAEAMALAAGQPLSKPGNRVAEALYLVVTSPEFATQR